MSTHFLSARFFLSLLLLFFSLPLIADTSLEQQRENYKRATDALARGDWRSFRTLTRTLESYPLYPYLLYADYSVALARTPRKEIDHFLNRYADSTLAPRLRTRWLQRLRDTGNFKDFVHYYDPSISAPELACFYSYARYQLGQREAAIKDAIPLWQVGKSQPKECDPLFNLLIKNGHISEQVAWTRYTAAVLNHEYRLARYLERFFTSANYRQLAKNFMAVDTNANSVGQYQLFHDHSPEILDVISHGLIHLAAHNAPKALQHWNHYHQSHHFAPQQEARVSESLVKALYSQGHVQAADILLEASLDNSASTLLDWRLREAIKAHNWSAILRLSEKVAQHQPLSERWQYWRARALQISNPGGEAQMESQQLLSRVAQNRSFYGFLASEQLSLPPQFQHRPVPVTADQIAVTAASLPFQRIRELRYHNDLTAARREWNFVLQQTDTEGRLIAARIAQQWQWPQQQIWSMIQADYWDDIDVRFPLAFQQDFARQAEKTGLPVNLLMALSRQESAFSPDVVSPAGAHGLMQLMPATAQQTAKRFGIGYRGTDELHDPSKNIILGSRYYLEVIQRFGNNRILATAAYNAGPGRVEQWLRASKGTLPYDAWIETIPFLETRNYVQNVLAFSAIYAHHMKMPVSLLSEQEKKRLL